VNQMPKACQRPILSWLKWPQVRLKDTAPRTKKKNQGEGFGALFHGVTPPEPHHQPNRKQKFKGPPKANRQPSRTAKKCYHQTLKLPPTLLFLLTVFMEVLRPASRQHNRLSLIRMEPLFKTTTTTKPQVPMIWCVLLGF